MDLEQERQRQAMRAEALSVVKEYLKSGAFQGRNLTDIPTDDNAMVNRRYTNLNGTVANRPTSSVATIGQKYFATDTGIPMVYSTQGWRNGVGSLVAAA